MPVKCTANAHSRVRTVQGAVIVEGHRMRHAEVVPVARELLLARIGQIVRARLDGGDSCASLRQHRVVRNRGGPGLSSCCCETQAASTRWRSSGPRRKNRPRAEALARQQNFSSRIPGSRLRGAGLRTPDIPDAGTASSEGARPERPPGAAAPGRAAQLHAISVVGYASGFIATERLVSAATSKEQSQPRRTAPARWREF